MKSPPASHLTVYLLVVCALGCTSTTYSEPSLRTDDWTHEVKVQAVRAAEVTAAGASAAGSAVGTAYTGVRDGFALPDEHGYGAFPTDYASTVRKHMIRFDGVSEKASFRFGKPERGYLNKGILAGGKVEWQGYLVPVDVVKESLFDSQTKPESYVVRMFDGEVVEVMEAEYATTLRWTDRANRPDHSDSGVAANAD
jgi:hypothetical protein